ncbi:MAG: phosphoadenylyl-sulfate reductase [Acidobacteriota bacterium]|nr:phosphoadenylyl-sulfate reductase [Acidobacteriota bacterium]
MLQDAEELVRWSAERFGSRLALITSFQREGMVLVDMAARLIPGVALFTLDTGRLPAETFQMFELVKKRYGMPIHLISPEPSELEYMVTEHGPDLFRTDVASRMLCCNIRKVRPLARRMRDYDACLVGLRREQNESRAGIEQVDWHSTPVKIAPLAFWSGAEVEAYTERHRVPDHPLYARGFASIGCAPCTRAIQPGENERDGRWWWEEGAAKECGLHFTADGRAQRRVDVLLEDVLSHARA